MGKNPYSDLPKSAFWKTGVAQENPYVLEGVYKKKFEIPPNAKIATAGSCFAQHISRHLKKNGYNVLDVEPPPPDLPDHLHQKFGFSMYSARYGNIYTVRQLLQLAQEVADERNPQNFIWEKDGKYYDALRPAIEPEGLDSPEVVIKHRQFHISRLKELFLDLDLFIFTLGLTEMWVHKESGTVYPTAPGTLIGDFDENLYKFKNAGFMSIVRDFKLFQKVLKKIRGGKPFKCILTVSPVPLTATASGKHVLPSTIYSKSTLRSVAGHLSMNQAHIDYFPSYEIVTNPRFHSGAFSDNLRTVRSEAVQIVMNHFFASHQPCIKFVDSIAESNTEDDVQCEESLVELELSRENTNKTALLLVGNSHSNQMITSLSDDARITSLYQLSRIHQRTLVDCDVHDIIWNSEDFFKTALGQRVDLVKILQSNYFSCIKKRVVLVGLYLWGDGLIRLFGTLRSSIVNGELKMVEMPCIPIIKEIADCPSSIKQAMERQINFRIHYFRKFIKNYPLIDFTWCTSPAIPEHVARTLFGDEYVDSASQVLYNKIYYSLLKEFAGDLLADGKIIISDINSLTKTGFLVDTYAECHVGGVDIHASESFYADQVVAGLLR